MGNDTSSAIDIDDVVTVPNITPRQLGKILVQRCGNEGCWSSNNCTQILTRKMLQAAINFIPEAQEAGANINSITYIIAVPGREFVVKSGNDWQFMFSIDGEDNIRSACTDRPFLSWMWNKFTSFWTKIVTTTLALLGISTQRGINS